MAKVAIIGAGAMGLAAAWHALEAGHDVTVFEADSVAGGMAAHFDFGGVSLERFYHFICKPDHSTFELLEALGIADSLRWRDTSMGYFYHGAMHDWGNPVALLKFPGLGLIDKVRYGAQMFLATKRKRWEPLDDISARDWIESGAGKRAYQVLWKDLMDKKFHQHADRISAAWLWSRVNRLGNSRKSVFQETLGYLEGGSQTLVDALVAGILARGGQMQLAAKVTSLSVANLRVRGVMVDDEERGVDAVICTVPTPYVAPLVPALPEASKAAYRAIDNIGVVCVVLKLAKSVTPNFWVNIVDDRLEIPGIVEFSNLRPLPQTVVYVPFYLPPDSAKFAQPDEAFVAECLECVQTLNPAISDADLLDSKVGRLRHAQPVCPPGFGKRLPPVQTPVKGLQIADTCFYYPEDRGISESVRLGKQMAVAVDS